MDGGERVLVTGAGGVLGRIVVAELRNRGIAVRAAVRRRRLGPVGGVEQVGLDVTDRTAWRTALAGVAAVVHCATDPRRHRRVDLAAARALGAEAGGIHVVFPGIVGSDLVPLGYYRSKTEAEEIIGGLSAWTVVRATQFHQLIWAAVGRLGRLPVLPVPNDTRFQVLDPAVVARLLVDSVIAGPGGRRPDVGGPFAYEASELARSWLRANERARPVLRVNVPGLVGAAFRAGANLTEHRDGSGLTWNQFVDRMAGRLDDSDSDDPTSDNPDSDDSGSEG